MNPEPHGQQVQPADAIDAALAGLDELDELPVAEHVARFDEVHDTLARALATIDGI